MNSSEHQPDSGEAGSDSSADHAELRRMVLGLEDRVYPSMILGLPTRESQPNMPDTFAAPEPSSSDEEDELPEGNRNGSFLTGDGPSTTPQSIVRAALLSDTRKTNHSNKSHR